MIARRELVNFPPAFGGLWHLFCNRAIARRAITKQVTQPLFLEIPVHNVTFGVFWGLEGGRKHLSAGREPLQGGEFGLFNSFYYVVVKFSEVNRGVLPEFALYSGNNKRPCPPKREEKRGVTSTLFTIGVKVHLKTCPLCMNDQERIELLKKTTKMTKANDLHKRFVFCEPYRPMLNGMRNARTGQCIG